MLAVAAVFAAGLATPALAGTADPSAASPPSGVTTGGQRITLDDADVRRAMFVQVSTGTEHSVGLTADGKVYAWGSNDMGQLGTDSRSPSTVPVPVKMDGALYGLTVTSVAAGGKHTLARTSDGQVFAWGDNRHGQLGIDSTLSFVAQPISASRYTALTGHNVTRIAAGEHHSVALTSAGDVYAWGYNGYGQVGDGTRNDARSPVRIGTDLPLGSSVATRIAAGAYHTVAVISSGIGYAWGANDSGQLGSGDAAARNWPTLVLKGAMGSHSIVEVSAGAHHTVVIGSDDRAYAWGLNNYGQLGTGNGNPWSYIAVAVNTTGPLVNAKIKQVAAGWDHSVAVVADGRAYAWGRNDYGQLGNGSTAASRTPVPTRWGVYGVESWSITHVDAGANQTGVTVADGRGFMWGQNQAAQQGNGTGEDGTMPRPTVDHVIFSVYFGSHEYPGTGTVLNRYGRSLTTTTPAHPAGQTEVFVEAHDIYR